ncbi:chemotaxis protein CheV [Oceanimonas baumannii]|uniref:Chemotaxis protein CheW n=1 Tax=Oceanimonas baumannii TaxID=129578 RepID=A0A235CMT1_9GAMM|nr:chemotaxis protein CheV [Oceanimonas baumannii]OYD25873.1 chemotaxis protein CheW [Oceanimonas baumannii]TDW60111.1 two-component system chemotaxis response regulator CheV [Oceanimonas baumannii]
MAGVLDSVNQRTQLVGQNRLELLLFRLNGRQRFGINVFKVKEVLQCPRLSGLPQRHPVIRGVANIRGQTISIIDLSKSMGGRPVEQTEDSFVIISEYNRSVQGFLVSSVERIINVNWESILPPPKGAGRFNYMTAVTEIDGELVEILDVEKILDEISPASTDVDAAIVARSRQQSAGHKPVLIADDSSVARRQVVKAVESLGLECIVTENGRQALNKLVEMAAQGPIEEQVSLVISDVEMPEMDGYTLTAEIRSHPALKSLHVILHTSLSGVFNKALVEKVGADNFIAKFQPDELATAVSDAL